MSAAHRLLTTRPGPSGSAVQCLAAAMVCAHLLCFEGAAAFAAPELTAHSIRRASTPSLQSHDADLIGVGGFDLQAERAYFRTGFNAGPEIANPSPGQSVVFHFDWRVNGIGGPTEVGILASIDDTPFCATTASVSGGDSLTTFCNGAWTATAGPHTLEWEVDYLNAVPEANEGNNKATRSWTAGAPTVTFTAVPPPTATRTATRLPTKTSGPPSSPTPTAGPPSPSPTGIPTETENFYQRGDADCSVHRSAADIVATIRALGGDSRCGNDDCDRDGSVAEPDVDCAARCLFGLCPVPPHAPRITEVAPATTMHIAPFAPFLIHGENFGPEDQLKRVLVDGVDVEVAEYRFPDTLVAVLPELPAGPAQVTVIAGDVAGAPSPMTISEPTAIGQADTFAATMELWRDTIDTFAELDLESLYGDAADDVRFELDRAAEQLGAPLAAILADGQFEAVREQLDFALEVSGLPEALRQLVEDMRGPTVAAGFGAALNPTVAVRMVGTAYQVGTVVQTALQGAAAAAPAAPLIVLIAKSVAVAVVAAVVLDVTLRPALSEISFFDPDGGPSDLPVAGGIVRVRGYNLMEPSSLRLVIAAQTRLERRGQQLQPGQVDFRIPEGIGICGRVVFLLRRTGVDLVSRAAVRAVFEPQLIEVLRVGSVEQGDSLDVEVSGVLGCDGFVNWERQRKDGTTFATRTDYRADTPGDPAIMETSVPRLLLGESQIFVKVHGEESNRLPVAFDSGILDLQVSCADPTLDLVNEPTTRCTVKPFPLDKRYPAETEFDWRTTDASVFTIEGRPGIVTDLLKQQVQVEAVGLGEAEVRIEASSDGVRFVQGFEGALIRVSDVTPPSAVVRPGTGQSNQVEAGSSITVEANAFDLGGSQVASLRLITTGDAVARVRPQARFDCPLSHPTSCDTSYTIELRQFGFNDREVAVSVEATDTAGNSDTSNEIVFTIKDDEIDPTVSLTSSSSHTVPAGGAVQVEVLAQDNMFVQTVRLFTAGDAVESILPSTTVSCPLDATPDLCRPSFTIRFRESGFSDPQVTVVAEAFDQAGNSATSNPLVFQIGSGGRTVRGTVFEVRQEDYAQSELADAVVQLFDSERNLAGIDTTDGDGAYQIRGFWDDNIIMKVTKSGLASGSRWFDRITISTQDFRIAPVNDACTSALGTFDVFSGAGAPGNASAQTARRTFGEADVGDSDQLVHPDAASICVTGGFASPTFSWKPEWTRRTAGSCESRIRLLFVSEWLDDVSQWKSLWSVEIPPADHERALIPPIQYGDASQGESKGEAPGLRADGTFYKVELRDGCGFNWGLVFRSR